MSAAEQRETEAPEASAAEAESQASGSSFYMAMRVLPKARRDAMFAIYSFCREVDDIADEDDAGTPEERRAALDRWRDDVAALYRGEVRPSMAMLAGPVAEFNLREGDFRAIIDGMQMDVDADIQAPDYSTLDLYCDRVASAVGRLSVRVFGMDGAENGDDLALHLGRALQLTNILRDLDEDAEMNRLYLPSDALQAAGIEARDPDTVLADPRLDAACRWVAARAREHYAKADALMKGEPISVIRAPKLMRIVYGRYLDRMEETGWAPPRAKAKLSKRQLLWIVLRHGLVG